MTDVTKTLSGTAAIPAQTLTIKAQTISVQATITFNIPAQSLTVEAENASVNINLDETQLAADLAPMLGSVTPPSSVTTVGGSLTDYQGNVWAMVASGKTGIGNQISLNGKVDTTTANVIGIYEVQASAGATPYIYQENSGKGFWQWLNGKWVGVAALPTPT